MDGAPSSIGLAKTAAQSTFVPYHQQAYVQSLQKVKFKGSSGAARHAPVQGGTRPANLAAFACVRSQERRGGFVSRHSRAVRPCDGSNLLRRLTDRSSGGLAARRAPSLLPRGVRSAGVCMCTVRGACVFCEVLQRAQVGCTT